MELTHHQHIEEFRDVVIARNEECVKQVISKHLQDERNQHRLPESAKMEAAEREKRKRDELLRPYNRHSEVEQRFGMCCTKLHGQSLSKDRSSKLIS